MLEAMKRTLEKVKDISGLMTGDELALLCRFARSASSIAELGCFKGKSLAAMGITNPKAKLYGIDWFGDMSHRGYKGSTLEETTANLKKAGVHAEFFVGTTDEMASKFDKKIDLLNIDAGHSFEECWNDIQNYVPKITPGGAVCIHDYGKARCSKLDRPEVQEAVDKWRNDNWIEVERAGTMIAFRNVSADAGILYVAFGEKAILNVENSIQTVKKFAPTLPIAVVSDKQVKGADHIIFHVDIDAGARSAKTRMYSLSPFRKTLFLDADTEMKSDPMHGFGLLDHVDMVIAQDPVRIFRDNTWPALVQAEVEETIRETKGGEFLYYNSGVIFFRRSAANKGLFQAWNQEWTRWGRQDQPALFRAMYKHPVRIAPMRAPWNTHQKSQAQFIYHAHRRASREGAPK
jgi:hypothetical protein